MNIGIDGRAAKWYRGTGIGTYTYQLINNLNKIDNINKYSLFLPQNGIGLSENVNCLKTITLHDIIPLKMPETVSDLYLNLFNNQLPKIISNCDAIITVSQFSKNDISKEFNFLNNPFAP